MNQITPFSFDGRSIRVVTGEDGEPLFVAKDICESLGYKDPTTAVRSHCKGVQKQHPLPTSGGVQELRVLTESDVMRLIVNSTLPSAEPFERWVFDEVLPTIRKTGSYSVPAKQEKPTAIGASREFRALYGIARLIGCDKNAAAISANQAVHKLTGQNVLALLGQVHMESERQELFFTPSELGARPGVTGKTGTAAGREFNLLLQAAGLHERIGNVWVPSPAAEGYCRILDTGKKHMNGTPVQQIKWSERVLDLFRKAA